MPRDEWRPPAGVSAKEFAALHSLENLGQHWYDPWNGHVQGFTHRNGYIPGMGLAENTLQAMQASKDAGHNLHEFDIVETRDGGHLIDHDMSPYRTTGRTGVYKNLLLKDVVDQNILIRHFQNNDFAPTSTLSGEKTMSAPIYMPKAREIVPKGTFFADCRDNDFARFIAWLSHQEFCVDTLVMVYTFTITFGFDITNAIEACNPAANWKSTVKIVLNLYPDQLVPLAKRWKIIAKSTDDFYAVGKLLLESCVEAGVPLAGLLSQPTGITLADLDETEMNDENARNEVFAEMAVPMLLDFVREHPVLGRVKIGTGTRGYDVTLPQPDGSVEHYNYDLWTCKLTPWPKGIRREIKIRRATPGLCEIIVKPSFVCMDAPERCQFACCGVPADKLSGFNYPKYDVVELSSE